MTQTITDQNGKTAELQLDGLGNLIREENQVGDEMVRSYQPGTSYLKSETQIIGLDDTPGATGDVRGM